MDNETKLSKEQLQGLISDLKNSKDNSQINIDEFAKKHLNEKQAQKLKQAMNNPDLMKFLSSPQAKKLLEKLKGDDFSK